MAKRMRSKKFTRVEDRFSRLSHSHRTPEVFRALCDVAGIDPIVVDDKLRLVSSMTLQAERAR